MVRRIGILGSSSEPLLCYSSLETNSPAVFTLRENNASINFCCRDMVDVVHWCGEEGCDEDLEIERNILYVPT